MEKLVAFVHIEKAAGTTITEMLREYFGADHADVFALGDDDAFSQKDLNKIRLIYPKLKSIAGHRVKPYLEFNEEILFYTILRNPIDRTISHYQYLIETSLVEVPDFKTWISKVENQNFQTKKIAGEASLEKAINIIDNKFSYIGTLECFDKSIKDLFYILPYKFELKEFKSQNTAKNNSLKQKILNDSASFELLRKHNSIDIQLYNYIQELNGFKRERKEKQILLPSKNNRIKWIHGAIIRNLLFKPYLRLINFKLNRSIKIKFQMVGLESSYIGHFFPNLQIKIFKILYKKRKSFDGGIPGK